MARRAGIGTAIPGLMSTATIVGIALGWWCGKLADGGLTSWQRAGHTVSERAFPWVLVAFGLGVATAWITAQHLPDGPVDPHQRRRLAATTVAVAATGASLALVIATVVYYRDLPLTAPRTVGWSVISVFIGTTFGGLGAVWAIWRRSLAGTLAVVALSATVAGEAVMVLFWGADGGETAARAVTISQLAIAATAALALPLRHRLSAVGAIAVLTPPAAGMIGAVLTYTGNV